MNAVDPRAIHYMLPCEKVRGQEFLYSNFYLAVTCDDCLNDRPPTTLTQYTSNKPLMWSVFASNFIFAMAFTPIAVIHFMEGNAWLGAFFAAQPAVFAAAVGYYPINVILKPLARIVFTQRGTRRRR